MIQTTATQWATVDMLDLTVTTETLAGAVEIAGKLPKSLRVRAQRFRRSSGAINGVVTLRVTIRANGVNGGTNEAGIKRYRSMVKHLAKMGIEVEHTMPYTNSITRNELEAAIS